MRWALLALLVACGDAPTDTSGADSDEPVETDDPWAGAIPATMTVFASGRVMCEGAMPHLVDGTTVTASSLEPCIGELATFEGTLAGSQLIGVLNTGNTDFAVEGVLTDTRLEYRVWLDLVIEVVVTARLK